MPGVIFSICGNHGRLWMNHRDCCVCCFFTAQLYLGLFVVGLWYYRDFLKCILYINWISALCMLPRYLTRFFTRWEVHRTFFRNYAYGIAVYILEDISGKKGVPVTECEKIHFVLYPLSKWQIMSITHMDRRIRDGFGNNNSKSIAGRMEIKKERKKKTWWTQKKPISRALTAGTLSRAWTTGVLRVIISIRHIFFRRL